MSFGPFIFYISKTFLLSIHVYRPVKTMSCHLVDTIYVVSI